MSHYHVIFNQLATWFGLGRLPKAPGTWGTLGAIPLVWLLTMMGSVFYMVFSFLFCLFGIFVSEAYERYSGKHDPKEIVIDEVAGFLITMTWIPLNAVSLLAGFVLFRILDILKPFPIGLIDKKVKGGLGVMADDILAGVLANLLLQMVFTQTNWLGYQLGA